jgi:WD40 repeat protein
MIAHAAPISGIATSNGRYVATAGYDNQVILWDAQRGRAVARALHDHLANQCAFSPDGRLLASSSSDYTARIWSVPDMRLRAVLGDHEDDVETVAFHQRRPWIATGSRDKGVRVFDHDGQLLQRMHGHRADVICIAWLNDSDQLVTSSDDGTIKRWDAQSGRLLADIDLGGVETDAIAVAPDGVIFAGNDEGRIIAVGEDGPCSFPAHAAGIKRLIHDRETGLLLSMSYDRSAKFWTYSADRGLTLHHETQIPDIVWPRSGAFLSPDEVVFVTFGSGYATYRLESRSWSLDSVRDTHGVNAACLHAGSLYAVGDAGVVHRDAAAVASMGSLCNFMVPFAGRILTGGQMGRVFDAQTGAVLHQHTSPLNCGTAFTHRGAPAAIIGTYTGEGLVFAMVDGEAACIASIRLHDNAIKGVAESGGRIFSVCATGAAAWHDAETLQLLTTHKRAHDKIANGCVGLPGGWFASVSRDLKLRLWNPDGDADVLTTPHRNSIKCCATSRDGRLIATGDYAGSVCALELGGRRMLGPIRPTSSGISSLIAGPGERDFLATSYDGRIYRLSMEDGALVERDLGHAR